MDVPNLSNCVHSIPLEVFYRLIWVADAFTGVGSEIGCKMSKMVGFRWPILMSSHGREVSGYIVNASFGKLERNSMHTASFVNHCLYVGKKNAKEGTTEIYPIFINSNYSPYFLLVSFHQSSKSLTIPHFQPNFQIRGSVQIWKSKYSKCLDYPNYSVFVSTLDMNVICVDSRIVLACKEDCLIVTAISSLFEARTIWGLHCIHIVWRNIRSECHNTKRKGNATMDSVFPYDNQKLPLNDGTTYSLPAIHWILPRICLVLVGLVRIRDSTGRRYVN